MQTPVLWTVAAPETSSWLAWEGGREGGTEGGREGREGGRCERELTSRLLRQCCYRNNALPASPDKC